MSDNKAGEAARPQEQPISSVRPIRPGNRPVDGGAYTFTEAEKDAFVEQEPGAEKWFRKWIGGPELLRRNARHFLYLKDASPEDLKDLPLTRERVAQVEELRRTSQFPEITAMADRPLDLVEENIPEGAFVVIPSVASERRTYVPLEILEPGTLAGTTLFVVPDASLYEFGVLSSLAHMNWMRQTAEKAEEDYRYAPETVYNTFPWPEPTAEQKKRVEETAQAVLDARAKFPDKTLASLYDDRTMPSELREAHERNDRAVMEAYGMDADRAQEADLMDLLRIRNRELTPAES
ncbi:MAG: class I SAM-dependent DNA methyltransferase [Clostridia bacterium]|nr:class I SAM-dependent DNA methyltransferase [Clostridia bacterium]